ncbi:hypothetical protein [Rhodohalobacter sp. 614A]|uniref:hypothetical protein n=1 Tax=Rhodohalobacter sp. 614A TaxID=2908649 RepID=UPI001F409263|nr:hypothetical protein [Rhodohalobacter sp. 614A]
MFFKKIAMIAVLALLLVSCGDDSPSGSDDGSAPTLPSLENIQPDLSFFLNNNPQKATQTSANFSVAKNLALSLSYFSSFGQIYTGFFQGASQSQAEMENGAWVWDYDYSYGGEVASVVLTSRETGNELLWDLTMSYNGPEGSFENYTLISGRTTKDGSSGSWTLNALSSNGSNEVPLLVSEWEKQGDSQINIETNFYGDGGAIEGSYTYTQDASDFMMTVSGLESGSGSAVHWNTDTQEGYYETDSERKCWDGNLQDTPC